MILCTCLFSGCVKTNSSQFETNTAINQKNEDKREDDSEGSHSSEWNEAIKAIESEDYITAVKLLDDISESNPDYVLISAKKEEIYDSLKSQVLHELETLFAEHLDWGTDLLIKKAKEYINEVRELLYKDTRLMDDIYYAFDCPASWIRGDIPYCIKSYGIERWLASHGFTDISISGDGCLFTNLIQSGDYILSSGLSQTRGNSYFYYDDTDRIIHEITHDGIKRVFHRGRINSFVIYGQYLYIYDSKELKRISIYTGEEDLLASDIDIVGNFILKPDKTDEYNLDIFYISSDEASATNNVYYISDLKTSDCSISNKFSIDEGSDKPELITVVGDDYYILKNYDITKYSISDTGDINVCEIMNNPGEMKQGISKDTCRIAFSNEAMFRNNCIFAIWQDCDGVDFYDRVRIFDLDENTTQVFDFEVGSANSYSREEEIIFKGFVENYITSNSITGNYYDRELVLEIDLDYPDRHSLLLVEPRNIEEDNLLYKEIISENQQFENVFCINDRVFYYISDELYSINIDGSDRKKETAAEVLDENYYLP